MEQSGETSSSGNSTSQTSPSTSKVSGKDSQRPSRKSESETTETVDKKKSPSKQHKPSPSANDRKRKIENDEEMRLKKEKQEEERLKMRNMAEHTGDIEEYTFTHKFRGQALIFIHNKYDHPEVPPRDGTSEDEDKMKKLFKGLDFKVRLYTNLSDVLIKKKLEKAAKCKYNEQSDCLVCVFSTHGEQVIIPDPKRGFRIWKDSIHPSKGEKILVEDILDMFNNKNCPSLAGKPKFFFIQACRSRHERDNLRYDMGFKAIKHQGDPGQPDSSNPPDELDERRNPPRQQPIVCQESNAGPIDDLAKAARHMNIEEQLNPFAGGGDNIATDCEEVEDLYGDWTDDEDEDKEGDGAESGNEELDCGDDHEPNRADDQTDVKHGLDSGNLPPMPDQTDVKHGLDSGNLPPMPVELMPLVCPEDCLIMYPVMPGRAAFRNKTEGSWMLHFLHKNRFMLLSNSRLLPYLTKVCGDMGKRQFRPKELHVDPTISDADKVTKVAAVIVHKLSSDVRLIPKPKYLMASWIKLKSLSCM